jgi:hypothetical protein
VLKHKSHIFVSSAFGKGKSLLHLLTKITTIQAGDSKSPAFFMNAAE